MDYYATKEKRKPIIPENERMEMLLALACVSNVMLVHSGVDALRKFQPQIFCKGHDYQLKGLLPAEIEYCKTHNIEIRFTKMNCQTTTSIIERIKNG